MFVNFARTYVHVCILLPQPPRVSFCLSHARPLTLLFSVSLSVHGVTLTFDINDMLYKYRLSFNLHICMGVSRSHSCPPSLSLSLSPLLLQAAVSIASLLAGFLVHLICERISLDSSKPRKTRQPSLRSTPKLMI